MNKLILAIFFCASCFVYSQEVIKVSNEYILILSNEQLGEVGDTINIYRNFKSSKNEIGKAIILKIQINKYACKVIDGDVHVGDYCRKINFKLDDLFETSSEDKSYKETASNLKPCLGVALAVAFPQKGSTDIYSNSLSIGALFKVPQSKYSDLILEISYSFLSLSVFTNNVKHGKMKSLFVINSINRIKFDTGLNLDLGIGVYFGKNNKSTISTRDIKNATVLGVCAGPQYKFDYKGHELGIYIRFHAYPVENMWKNYINCSLELNF